MVQHQEWKLGEIAVYNRILTQAQIDECLAIQAQLAALEFPVRLGKILIEKYYIDRITLAALLRAQATQRGLPATRVDTGVDIVKFTASEHDTLVERVRERKLVQAEDLDGCIEVQFALEERGIDKQLGEICIEKGILARSVVSDILARHESRRQTLVQRVVDEWAAPAPPETQMPAPDTGGETGILKIVRRVETSAVRLSEEILFGRLVQEKDLATEEAVEDSLYVQLRLKEVGVTKRIGEVMVLKGVLHEPDVLRILQVQKQRMGRICWSDLAEAEQMEPEDDRIARALREQGLLDQDSLSECRFVQRVLREHGLRWSLLTVVTEKGYLDRRMIEKLRREQRVEACRTNRLARADQSPSVDVALDDLIRQG